MFESRLNRGKANGYASLDANGLVPTSSLPPIQSTIDTGSFVTTSSLQTLVNATGSFATTGSNQFSGSQVITGSLTVTSTVINNSSLHLTGSDLIIDSGSLHVAGGIYVSGSVTVSSTVVNNATMYTTGSNLIIESGSLVLSGSTVYGDIIPAVSKSFSLGSNEFPFKDIFISSGSLNIASDNPEAPNTILSNVNGNILISAGGMQLVGSASFNATTASFGYISGSMTQVGDYIQIGNSVVVGNKIITGSLNITGSATIQGTTTHVGPVVFAPSSSIHYSPRIVSGSGTTSLTVDFSKDSVVHCHTNAGTLSISLVNHTTGSIVEVYVSNNIGGTQQINHGVVSSINAAGANGNSFYLNSRPLTYLKYFCLDGTAANTFVVGIIN